VRRSFTRDASDLLSCSVTNKMIAAIADDYERLARSSVLIEHHDPSPMFRSTGRSSPYERTLAARG
jgi:hypothetical protein